jgi:predicted transposase/invertase (TIGR01784 family)
MAVRYLDPRNDLVFKRIFGEHEGILRSFLNALLPLPEDGQIISLEYLPAEQVPEVPLFKHTIVDVRCMDQRGRQFIVEMQMNWTSAFLQRVFFNASKAYVRQLERTESYKLLQPVIGLALINDVYQKESEQFYHHYQMVEAGDPQQKIDGIQLVFVELPKFKPEGLKQKLAVAWLRFLKETGDVDSAEEAEMLEQEIGSVAPEIREAVTLAKEGAFSRSELEAYDRYWDHVRSERTLISESRAEGLAIGIAEGIAEGRAKGKAEGIEEGKQIVRAAMVSKLVASGMSEADAQALVDGV